MRFDYALTGTGWATARIADGHDELTLTASYLQDALGDLLVAVLAAVTGAPEARCSWEVEPGEFRWLLRPVDDQIDVRILAFSDALPSTPDAAGTVVFRTTQERRVLASTIAAGAQRVLDQHGERGYRERWVEHPFPTGALVALTAAAHSQT